MRRKHFAVALKRALLAQFCVGVEPDDHAEKWCPGAAAAACAVNNQRCAGGQRSELTFAAGEPIPRPHCCFQTFAQRPQNIVDEPLRSLRESVPSVVELVGIEHQRIVKTLAKLRGQRRLARACRAVDRDYASLGGQRRQLSDPRRQLCKLDRHAAC